MTSSPAPAPGTSNRPRPQEKRYDRRVVHESRGGNLLTLMSCRDCGALVAYKHQAKHDNFHARLKELGL